MNRNAKLTVIGALTAFLCTTTSVLAFSPNKSVHPHLHFVPSIHPRLHVPSISDRIKRVKRPDVQRHQTGQLAKRNNPALCSQEAAQAAKELQRIQQMRDAEQARGLFGRSNSASDPATGTALGGHLPGANQSGSDNAVDPAARMRDCLANPANCFSNNSPGAQASSRMMQGPPKAGGGVPDQRGMASGDDWEGPGGGLWSKWVAEHGRVTNTSSGRERGGFYVQQHFEDGTEVSYHFDVDGTSSQTIVNPDGTLHSSYWFDENGEMSGMTLDEPIDASTSGGATAGAGAGTQTGKPADTDKGDDPEGDGEARQPGSNDSSTGNADPCGWTPWGCRNKRDVRTSIKQMTSQPVQGESGGTETGSGAPRLGLEAVTNSGDGSWSPQTAGRSGGGHPIDMRDPAPRGPDGTPVRQN
jgi:hypothetical protein